MTQVSRTWGCDTPSPSGFLPYPPVEEKGIPSSLCLACFPSRALHGDARGCGPGLESSQRLAKNNFAFQPTGLVDTTTAVRRLGQVPAPSFMLSRVPGAREYPLKPYDAWVSKLLPTCRQLDPLAPQPLLSVPMLGQEFLSCHHVQQQRRWTSPWDRGDRQITSTYRQSQHHLMEVLVPCHSLLQGSEGILGTGKGRKRRVGKVQGASSVVPEARGLAQEAQEEEAWTCVGLLSHTW